MTDHGVFGVNHAKGLAAPSAGAPVVACGPAVDALERPGCSARITTPNGVAPPPMTADEVRDRFGLVHGRHLLISVARLTAQKRHDMVERYLDLYREVAGR